MREEKRIAEKFQQFGVTEKTIHEIVKSGLARGFTRELSLVGARFSLSMAFDSDEYFSSEEIAMITGQSVEETRQMMIDSGCGYTIVRPASWIR